MQVFLETERLILRRFTEDDAAHLFELDSDPEVMRYIGPHALPNVEAYRQRITTRFLPYYARYHHFGFWVVVGKATGAFAGWFHLTPASDYRFHAEAGYDMDDVDIGFRFRRAAWGQGYATEGARVLVRQAFTETDAAAVVATVLAGNVASIRVLEKAGLKLAHEFALPGYDMPAVKYALRRDDFLVGPPSNPGILPSLPGESF